MSAGVGELAEFAVDYHAERARRRAVRSEGQTAVKRSLAVTWDPTTRPANLTGMWARLRGLVR